ncbi:MAG: S8 family serine peptidase [Chloroflexota bacterium]
MIKKGQDRLGRPATILALILTCLSFLAGPSGGFELSAVQAQDPAPAPGAVSPNGLEKITPAVQAALGSLQAGEMLTVIVTLKDQTDLQQLAANPARLDRAARLRGVVEMLRAKADLSQRALRATLAVRRAEGRVDRVDYFWIFNGLVVTAIPAVIQELAARPEVLSITPNETIQAPPLPPTEQGQLGILAVESNLSLINVPALWDLGYRGQGLVVANMDTGVDGSHPNLSPKWRGGSNSWYDPYGQHPTTPTDLAGGSSGHGTRTMGLMVGGEDNGNAFGIAPQARWIAVKVFRDDGVGTTAAFHQGFQWLLDPDGDSATADAPHVVNNSWTYGNPNSCNLTFQADLQALRAAGILPIFAAGNAGPNSSTSYSPANYPEALAVGNINNSNVIYSLSSRGPRPASSGCNDGTVFPEVVAPGVSVHTTDRFGLYTNATGTSFAAPHVAGVLALLLDASPGLTVAQQETALLNSVVDLGITGPDDTYGNGRLDALAGFQSLFDLSVGQSVSSSSIMVNNALTYTIAITNQGPLTATTVTLTDPLPPGMTFNSATSSQGNCSPAGGNTVTCALGNLTNGAAATVTIGVTVTMAGLLANTVSVAGIKPDLDMQNNSATANTRIIGQVFLPLILK